MGRLRCRLRLSKKMSCSLLSARSGPQDLKLGTRLLVDLGQQVPVTVVGEDGRNAKLTFCCTLHFDGHAAGFSRSRELRGPSER